MIISGAAHYFRTHPDQWADRLHWLRLMGLDTVETYVAWNLHEPRRGQFDFSGGADLERFVGLAAKEGLRVIVRPGPYICAEWDNGGFPAWLGTRPGLRLRTADPAYLEEVRRWFGELLPRLVPLQETHGGPISMVQVENEYGSFGSDATYLRWLADLLVDAGIDVPLFTSDGPDDHMLAGGTVPGIRATVNFGSRAREAFDSLAAVRPHDRPFVMEFWNGWFDHWGEEHHVRDAADAASVLGDILDADGEVNFYVAHGGTSFSTFAGANYEPPWSVSGGEYQPTITSYDYDAPLDERGAPTPKFHAFREAIARHREVPELEEFTAALLPVTELSTTGEVTALDDILDAVEAHTSPTPLTFEELGIAHGIVRYRATLRGPRKAQPLTIDGLADRAVLVVDGEVRHVFDRNTATSHELSVPPEGIEIELQVESHGRVNYGRLVGERKGITGAVLFERQEVHGWTMAALDLAELPDLPAAPATPAGTATRGFHRLFFEAAAPADGYLDLSEWGKGYVWVNGFGLGRYWSIGPQQSLYVPAPVVRAGSNDVIVLELDEPGAHPPTLRPEPVWS